MDMNIGTYPTSRNGSIHTYWCLGSSSLGKEGGRVDYTC